MVTRSSNYGRRSLSAMMCVWAATVVTLALCGEAIGQTTLYVDDDNYPGPGSGSLVDPFCSIQDAIIASLDGDTVEVAPGTYFEAIDFIGKAITLRSRDGAATTIIDAMSVPDTGSGVSVVRCVSEETAATVLDGFTITGGTGDTTAASPNSLGGGMYNVGSSPTITNCKFIGNTADFGGGMYNRIASNPTLINCIFSGNTGNSTSEIGAGAGMRNFVSSPILTNCIFSDNKAANGSGGGMSNHLSDVTLKSCMFIGNIATQSGGGMFSHCSRPKLTHCIFNENTATLGGGGGVCNIISTQTARHCKFSRNNALVGGGMHNESSISISTFCTFSDNTAAILGGGMNNSHSPRTTVTNCLFSGNAADLGGGMFNDSDTTLTNCKFIANIANSGGGMRNASGNPTIINCTFSGNYASNNGGAIENFFANPILANSVFYGNTSNDGGGMYNGRSSNVEVINCIMWDDRPNEIINVIFSDLFNADGTTTIAYSNIEGSGGSAAYDTLLGIDGGGNIDADPLFVDPLGADGVAGTVDDDLRLMASSPSIDAADYDAYLSVGGGLVDLDGKDRVIDNMSIIDTGVGSVTFLDMGAYEYGPREIDSCRADGIIDLSDLENLDGCLAGPSGGVGLGCGCVDFNVDEHLDLRDVALFQLGYHP